MARRIVRPSFFLGLALGQLQDYTTIAVLERPIWKRGLTRATYDLRHLERLPLGTPYPGIVARVRELMSEAFLGQNSRAWLVADATAVGPSVIDLLRQAGLRPVAVTITGGDTATDEDSNYRVPKRNLATLIQVLLQSQRLNIAEGLALGPILAEELPNFQVNPQTSHDSYYAWREGQHDDLVLAVVLACWRAEEAYWEPPPNRQIVFRTRRGDGSRAARDGWFRQ